jgi:DNA sulfur modification protein DndE
MALKLRTSKHAEIIFSRIEASENMPLYTLVKLAMALSIRASALKEEDFNTNTLGRELNRQTITGDADALYKCLVELREGRHLSDDEYFPRYVKAHIDRGVILLDQEQRYVGDFLSHLLQLDDAIYPIFTMANKI